MGVKKERDSNLELLRWLSMLAIMLLHYLNANMGGALGAVREGSAAYYLVYTLETLCIIGPNCFVLIAGYFMVEKTSFSLRKPIDLYITMVFYAFTFYALMHFLAPALITSGVTWKRIFFPFLTGDRWFVKAYIILYLLAPFLNKCLMALSEKSYRTLLVILFCLFSVWYTFWDGAPVLDGGYGFINFILLYSVAGYIRRFRAETRRSPWAMAGLWLLCAGASVAARLLWTPKAWSYSFASNILAAICLFLCFKNIRMPVSRFVNRMASHAFGVFLIHADLSTGHLLYHKLLRTELFWNSLWLLPHALVSVVVVYFASALIDMGKEFLFRHLADPILDRIPFLNKKIDA